MVILPVPGRPYCLGRVGHAHLIFWSANRNWSNPALWSDGFAPNAGQNLEIGFPVTVTINTQNADSGPLPTAVNNLTIDAGATLDIVSGGSLEVHGTLESDGRFRVMSVSPLGGAQSYGGSEEAGMAQQVAQRVTPSIQISPS